MVLKSVSEYALCTIFRAEMLARYIVQPEYNQALGGLGIVLYNRHILKSLAIFEYGVATKFNCC